MFLIIFILSLPEICLENNFLRCSPSLENLDEFSFLETSPDKSWFLTKKKSWCLKWMKIVNSFLIKIFFNYEKKIVELFLILLGVDLIARFNLLSAFPKKLIKINLKVRNFVGFKFAMENFFFSFSCYQSLIHIFRMVISKNGFYNS